MSSKLLNYPSASSNPHLGAGGSAGSSAAATRNGTSAGSHGSSGLNFDNLQLDDILCTVCQSVLVEPVFLPCQHRFCRNCLSGTIEKNNLNCPCCRKRFGTWYRNASRVNKLVHEQLWNAIQSQFRDYLDGEDGTGAGRCNGNGSVGGCFVPQSESVIHISEPGEIRKEYESELQRYRKELIEEKKKELAASEKYIINLYKQEGIIDLVDSSDHLSISSTTSTPEPPANERKRPPPQPTANHDAKSSHEVVEDDEEAGPSGSGGNGAKPEAVPNQNSAVTSTSQNVHRTSRPETPKSQSNGSVISISSTSSASGASSSCISSASSRYSLAKQQQTSKAQSSNQTSKQGTGGGAAVVKKVFTMAELNQNELCVKPTKLHRRTSSQAVDDDDDDGDSLRSELNHFKPIFATTPKSCFSSKTIVRVPSVRPETTGSLPPKTECFSPSKSPFKPIDPTTPRRSAFSVVNVNLFTPPTTTITTTTTDKKAGKVQKRKGTGSAEKKSAKKQKMSPPSSGKSNKRTAKKPNGTNPDTERRKRKLKFSPQPKAKVKEEPSVISTTNNRITTRRMSLNRQPSRLKDLIVSDQQRREAMIEQERRDFEFAQKLQKKLNRTRGAGPLLQVEPLPREAPTIVARKQNSTYSLRRQTVAVLPPTAKVTTMATELPPPPPPPPLASALPPSSRTSSSSGAISRRESLSGGTRQTSSSRKRNTSAKADDSPKSVRPPTRTTTMTSTTNQIKKPKLLAATKTIKTRQPLPPVREEQEEKEQKAPAEARGNSESRILRRSTRIRS